MRTGKCFYVDYNVLYEGHDGGRGMKDNKLNELSKEQLIKRIKELEKQKKYGLVWEDQPEDVISQCQTNLPVLEELIDKAIIAEQDMPTNILIEGDNYHALSVLNYTHAGKIDVIYIDPPYNTGSGDFKYNDAYINKEDTYRHSKWLSFIDRRIRLATYLMKEKGVLFVSIDDNEVTRLVELLIEIFGEDNVEIMIWKKSGFGRDGKMKNTTTFRKDHEYIIVCYKNEKRLNKIIEMPEFQNEYGNPDDDPRGPYKAGSISRKEEASNPQHENYYTVISPSGKQFTRQFDITEDEFDYLNTDYQINKNGKKVSRIYWGKNDNAVPAIKIFIWEERSITPYSVLLTKGTTTEGTKQVSQILEKDCKLLRPKPTKLISTLIQLADKEENITVLDFFAGTGSTGHALLEYCLKNAKTNSKFILCTNNEGNICTEYCYPRLRKVMVTGYKSKKGEFIKPIKSNLRYFRTSFVSTTAISDDTRRELVKRSTEMICLREGSFEKIIDTEKYKIFKNKDQQTGILFDLDALHEFKKKIEKNKCKTNIYVFSLTTDTFDEDFQDLSVEHEMCPIPESILDVYKKIFKENNLKHE